MKKVFLIASLLFAANSLFAQEFTLVTTIESVVPAGLGRSRMITTTPQGKLEEVSMQNYFSLVGINFENIRENDLTITTKIAEMSKQGWNLVNVNSGVYAADRSTGLFITRYLFKRETEVKKS